MSLRCETRERQKRLVSKIEAKFRSFGPFCKILGGMSEVSE